MLRPLSRLWHRKAADSDAAARGAILAGVVGLHLAILAGLLSYRILLPEEPEGPAMRLDLPLPLAEVPAPARTHPVIGLHLVPVPLPDLVPDLPKLSAGRQEERRLPPRRTREEVMAEEALTPSVAARSLAGRGFDLISPPSYALPQLRNRLPVYPEVARRQGEEGLVILRVLVDPSGRSQSVLIHRSSGFPRLDEAAQQAVLRWRFYPAERGRVPVTAWLLVPLRFVGGVYVMVDESAFPGRQLP